MATGASILKEHPAKEILSIIDRWSPETEACNETLEVRIVKALLNADACVTAYETDLK